MDLCINTKGTSAVLSKLTLAGGTHGPRVDHFSTWLEPGWRRGKFICLGTYQVPSPTILSWRRRQSGTRGDAELARFSKVESPQRLTDLGNILGRSVLFREAKVVLLYQMPSEIWTLPGGSSRSAGTSWAPLATSAGAQFMLQANADNTRINLKRDMVIAGMMFVGVFDRFVSGLSLE